MPKKPLTKYPRVIHDEVTGRTSLRFGPLIFQDPASKDFMAWRGPTVEDMVGDAANKAMLAEVEEFKAITVRTKVQDVALLDEFAKLLGKSRNEAASDFLGAALREALATLPDDMRERLQLAAFSRLGWAIATTENVRTIKKDGPESQGGESEEQRSSGEVQQEGQQGGT